MIVLRDCPELGASGDSTLTAIHQHVTHANLTRNLPAQEAYAAYQSHFQQGPTTVLRDCLELVASGEPKFRWTYRSVGHPSD